jgi:[protein-PII] uridylyltransferase
MSSLMGAGDEGEVQYRDLISMVETQAPLALASDGPLPQPRSGRVSRRVRSFPVTPRVSLAGSALPDSCFRR